MTLATWNKAHILLDARAAKLAEFVRLYTADLADCTTDAGAVSVAVDIARARHELALLEDARAILDDADPRRRDAR